MDLIWMFFGCSSKQLPSRSKKRVFSLLMLHAFLSIAIFAFMLSSFLLKLALAVTAPPFQLALKKEGRSISWGRWLVNSCFLQLLAINTLLSSSSLKLFFLILCSSVCLFPATFTSSLSGLLWSAGSQTWEWFHLLGFLLLFSISLLLWSHGSLLVYSTSLGQVPFIRYRNNVPIHLVNMINMI